MLRQLTLPSGTDPNQRVIADAQLRCSQRADSIIAEATDEAKRMLRVAASDAESLREQAQTEGYCEGYAHALHSAVPILSNLLAERSRWMASVRSSVLGQLSAELSRLEFTQAQIERWCALQSEQGAHLLAVYLPADQAALQHTLQQRLGAAARVELADVPAPVVSADDMVFVLEPSANLPVSAATENLALNIQSFAEYQAERYRRAAVPARGEPALVTHQEARS
jgi:hypothetical protein